MMSCMFIGATGLKSHAEGISVISNNLANVNTVGYKQMSIQYAALMSAYQTTSSANLTNCSQKGMGAVTLANRTLFEQGGIETGSSSTDICINGRGFFGVTKNGVTNYTRAGDLRFSKTGELLDPSGWNVLGRAIVNGVESATASPIIVDTSETGAGYMPPKASSYVSLGSQLGGLENKSADAENPFFSMVSGWNADEQPALKTALYSHSEPIEFYDSQGNLRQATVYYDAAGTSGGLTAVEYLVALNPSEDASALADTKAAGLLMAGTLTFASNGEMASMTAFSPPASGDPADLAGWTPAPLQNGQPVMSIQATNADAQQVTLDLGFVFTAQGASAGAGLASAAEAAGNPSAVYTQSTPRELKANSTNIYGELSSTYYSTRDGYAAGYLQDVTVSADGVLRGQYSNSQDQDLYRISLYRFTSQDGLRHEGNNHYAATKESGAAEEGIPGDENFGTLASNSLEQSNVDYAREFSLLIVTQRGFQMNSKVVTTADQMLQKALEIKR